MTEAKVPEGRAHTPEQKRAVIEVLYASWLACPDMRLGQLLANAAHDCGGDVDLFYIGDRRLASAVDKFTQR